MNKFYYCLIIVPTFLSILIVFMGDVKWGASIMLLSIFSLIVVPLQDRKKVDIRTAFLSFVMLITLLSITRIIPIS